MRLSQCILLVAMLFLLVSCSKSEPVRVGFVGGLSGRVADLGIAGRNGVILATEELNRSGGINGRRVELLIRDDEQTPEKARQVVDELLAAKVAAIIGHMTSSMSVATVDQVNASRTVMLSPTTTTIQLEGLDDYFLRVVATTKNYARAAADYLYDKGIRNVSAIYDERNLAYTSSWLSDFSHHFESRGGKVLGTHSFESGSEIYFSQLVRKVLDDAPGAILTVTSALDTAMFAQQLRKTGSGTPIVSSEWAGTERLIDLGGPAVEGIVLDQFFDRDSRQPTYLAFRNAYLERFATEPGFASVAAYDAANTLFSALRRTTDPAALKQAVLDIGTFNGVQTQFTIDRFGDASRPTFLAIVEDGHFKRIK